MASSFDEKQCLHCAIISLMSLCLSLAALLAAAVADIRSFTVADYKNHRPITLTGCVTARNEGSFILTDDSGSWRIHEYGSMSAPATGLVVTARCFGTVHQNQFLIFTTNCMVAGACPVPAPSRISIDDALSGRYDYKIASVSATVVSETQDDIDPRYSFLLLNDGTNTIVAACQRYDTSTLLGAQVTVTGLVDPVLGRARRFQGRGIRHFGVPSNEFIHVVNPSPADRFEAPEYIDTPHVDPRDFLAMGRKSVIGTVRAVWNGDRFLLNAPSLNRRYVTVILARGEKLPACGQTVKAVGLPRTDLVSILLDQAIWRVDNQMQPPDADTAVLDIPTTGLFSSANEETNAILHGQNVRVSGIVRSIRTDLENDYIQLQSGDRIIHIDVSNCGNSLSGISQDCKIEATGVCLLQSDIWHPDMPVPEIRGFSIVVRSGADVRILSRPSWWTPTRLVFALASLLFTTIGILIWNRMLGHVINRRSRELAREQIAHDAAVLKVGERTRLAVELHDSLSQNLEGLACQISAIESSLSNDPPTARELLATARQMLQSCRTELRSCLFDLRGDALGASTFSEALAITLRPFMASSAISIRFDARTSHFNDSTVHAVLCIVRELVTNAIRHGQAKHIHVAGEYRECKLRFSVKDDGCGFDPVTAPGFDMGHFGLSGIRTRVERLGGTYELAASPGNGTYARITISKREP